MITGEKYQLLRSSVDAMISFKYLVAFCAMLFVGWNPAFAATADDTVETGATTTQTSKTHHKKHHAAKTAATDSTSIAGKTTGDTTEKSASTAETTKTPGKRSSTPTVASTDETKSSTATTSTGKSHKKKGRNSSTATSTNSPAGEAPDKTGSNSSHTTVTAKTTNDASPERPSSATPAGKAAAPSTVKSANVATPPVGVAAAAATAVTGQAAVATTGKGKHRRHGAATPAIPQPPIVINPAAISPPITLLPNPVANAMGDAPKIETNLPVPRPGAGTTASLPFAMIRNASPEVKTSFSFNDFPTHKHTQTYPWKNGIVTTVFWIGEGSTPLSAMTNLKSAWDGNWVHNNGGADDQYDMSGYGSGSHASTLNPFYIALPFNDLAYPDKTSRWLPDNWTKPQRRGNKPISACQHRWIEIKNRAGRVCFAQWEDVGPIVTDDAEYVFGPSRPSASRGLDVSPAVAKYLGIDSTAVTSWRFVDDEDVMPGMWLRYDEQALLFRAMKEKLRGGGTNTRIQQLEEPTPEDEDTDANQKKVGAARG